MKRLCKEAISHLTVIWGLMLLTFWVTDQFNSAMAFINHDMTKGLLFAFALTTLSVGLFLVTDRAPLWQPLRTGIGALSLLGAAGVIALLIVDRYFPRLLLFVNDGVKFALLCAILWGICAAILGICYRRVAYNQTISKENSK